VTSPDRSPRVALGPADAPVGPNLSGVIERSTHRSGRPRRDCQRFESSLRRTGGL